MNYSLRNLVRQNEGRVARASSEEMKRGPSSGVPHTSGLRVGVLVSLFPEFIRKPDRS